MSHQRPRPRTNAYVLRMLAPLLAALFPTTLAAPERFPYIPTTILAPTTTNGSADDGLAYVFREKDGNIELASLDAGGSVDGNNGLKVLTSRLPFLDEATDTTIFSPTLADSGELLVYVGDCDSEYDHGIWSYTPSDDDAESGWEKHSTTFSDDPPKYAGPNFLGASLSFSSQLSPSVSPPVLYTFGGMCANASSASTWQSSGRYSNAMRKASPSSNSEYAVSSVESRGPVREAGFTLTGLQPALSERGERVTQRASYVLLGGHTQEAFINMSTAAVWNLPEETWSFVDIRDPRHGGSELRGAVATRAGATVDSRSGHTAVLNGDGDELVLLGGWVGNVSRAAEPQLVVLRMGDSYDEWEWVVPEKQPDGSGVYGHGAALLPGNVMMVYGGYEITETARKESKSKRAFSDGPQFLDLESMKWSSSYTSPSGSKGSPDNERAKQDQDDDDSKDGDDGKAKRLGLGIGLGLGVPLLTAVIALLLYRRRFTNRRRSMRDDAIAALAQDRAQFLQSGHDMAERDNGLDAFQPWPWYAGGGDPYDNAVRSLGSETLRRESLGLGLGMGAGQGMQVPRKAAPRPVRGAYQPAGSAVPPGIHPIYEADEEAEQGREERDYDAEALSGPSSPTRLRSDPFASPPSGAPVLSPPSRSSATPSPEGQKVDPEVQDWMLDVDAAEGLLTRRDRRQAQNGRISPTKTAPKSVSSGWEDDARTGSNLSESARSAISSITRSTSGRSHFRAGLGLINGSAGEGRLDSSSSGSPSYNTVKSSFPVLQAEGPTLLRGAEAEPYDPPQQQQQHHEESEDDFIPIPGSPSKNKPRRGWLGSLRRVFASQPTGYEPSDDSPTRNSFEHGPADFEAPPHRLASIGGGSLLRRKQGKRAWEADHNGENNPGMVGERRRGSGETDWDIERAVEQRLVQVMFTVPREPLRVVNGEAERDDASVKGRTSPTRSLGESPWGGLTLPEVKPVSPFKDPFVERAPSREEIRRGLEMAPSLEEIRRGLEMVSSREEIRRGFERASSREEIRREPEMAPSREEMRRGLEMAPSLEEIRREPEMAPSREEMRRGLEMAPSREEMRRGLERVPSPVSVNGNVQDVQMEQDAVVAPMAFPDRLEMTRSESPREREEDKSRVEEVNEQVNEAADEAVKLMPSRRKTKVQEMVASIESKSREPSPRRRS